VPAGSSRRSAGKPASGKGIWRTSTCHTSHDHPHQGPRAPADRSWQEAEAVPAHTSEVTARRHKHGGLERRYRVVGRVQRGLGQGGFAIGLQVAHPVLKALLRSEKKSVQWMAVVGGLVAGRADKDGGELGNVSEQWRLCALGGRRVAVGGGVGWRLEVDKQGLRSPRVRRNQVEKAVGHTEAVSDEP